MAFLIVKNGYSSKLSGLGKIKPFAELSDKRITKAVRKNLCSEYGDINIKVSCKAFFLKGTWHGECEITGKKYKYEIKQ